MFKSALQIKWPLDRGTTADACPSDRFRVQRELAVRVPHYDHTHYLAQLQLLWQWILCSLPLDLLFLELSLPVAILPEHLRAFDNLLLILLVLCCLGILRESLLDWYLVLVHNAQKLCSSENTLGLWILAGIGAVTAIVELVLRSAITGLIPLLVAVLLGGIIAYSHFRQLREQVADRELLDRDPIAWVERANSQIFYLTVFPIFAARALAVVALCKLVFADTTLAEYLTCFGTSLLLLMYLAPYDELLTIRCSRCAQRASRALKHSQHCPACARSKFQEKQARK